MSLNILDDKRAKTRAGKKFLENRAPKVIENPKSIIYMHGSKCSQTVQQVFKDLHSLTRSQSRIYSRKHDIRPMDDHAPLEVMSSKLDVSLFLVGTNNKKRPNNITFARMFNHHLLDMCEASVTNFKPIHKFSGIDKPAAMSKPALLFQGHIWDHKPEFKVFKSMLTDIFRGPVVQRVNLAGIDRVVVFSAEEPTVCMRQYKVTLKSSGGKLPIVELEECGPAIDLQLGRVIFAAEDLLKQALKQPKQLKPKKKKNIEYSDLGEKMGRVHMAKQDVSSMQLRKVKALKRSAKEREADGEEAKKSKDEE
eukprot:m.88030 g.88030  ORF g.88030 m.88030 type:complete len:308 (+) comp14524_c9_seq1:209-1132(+)